MWYPGVGSGRGLVTAGSTRDGLQGMAEPLSKAGDTTGRAGLRRGSTVKVRGEKRAGNNPTNCRARAGGGEEAVEQESTL